MKLCKVIRPGFFTTVQDLGRNGFQRYGVPVSGAMDQYAFTAANFLVKNDSTQACLEITMLGPELEFLNDAQLAITGAAFSITLNGDDVTCWRTLQVYSDDILSFGSLKAGCRAYLAVRGGISVPILLGSRSTYFRGKFGGYHGKSLEAGDIVEAYQNSVLLESGLALPEEFIPCYDNEVDVNVILGPQFDYFTEEGISTFFSSTYLATTEFDRMGYRLDGPGIKLKSSLDMISDALPVGAVQVPRNGKPIVIMRDAQTTGGYPKIAVVATPDVSRFGQVKPHDKIRFSRISLDNAQKKMSDSHRTINQMNERLLEFGL